MKNLGERIFLILTWPVVLILDLSIYLVMGKEQYRKERKQSQEKFKEAWNSLRV